MDEKAPKISAIIPVFGKAGDLTRLVSALRGQTLAPSEILVVDSNPVPLEDLPPGVKHVRNPKDVAYGYDYNLGAQNASGDFLLHMSQDCLPENERGLEELYGQMTDSRAAVAATVRLPEEVWRQYNFWGQVLMAQWVGDICQGISDKFDLIRKEAFLRLNGYDIQTFRFCGQDQDLYLRLSQLGEVFVAPTRVLHLHNQSKKTSWKELFRKQFQLAESFGALLRKWGWRLKRAPYAGNWTHHLQKFLYPLLLAIPFKPWTTIAVLAVLSNLTNLEAWRIRDRRVFFMLLLNPLLFLTGAIGTLKGLLAGKATYSRNK